MSLIDTPFGQHLLARTEMVEGLYKRMELELPAPPLTDVQIGWMNDSLGFKAGASNYKGHDYRPYCVRENCEYMPRMMRIKDGFSCWSCRSQWILNPPHPTNDDDT